MRILEGLEINFNLTQHLYRRPSALDFRFCESLDKAVKLIFLDLFSFQKKITRKQRKKGTDTDRPSCQWGKRKRKDEEEEEEDIDNDEKGRLLKI